VAPSRGVAACVAEEEKRVWYYPSLTSTFCLVPVAVETGALGDGADFLDDAFQL
jgi:hypothetical protein